MQTKLREERPVIRPARTLFEKVLEFVAGFGAAANVAAIVGIVAFWESIPDSVPQHFGIDGRPDAWGGKGVLLVLPIISLFLFAGLTALSRIPHQFNYPYRITAENAERQYCLARTLLSGLKMLIVWLFALIMLVQVQVAKGDVDGLGPAFVLLFLVLIFGTVVIYLVAASRAH